MDYTHDIDKLRHTGIHVMAQAVKEQGPYLNLQSKYFSRRMEMKTFLFVVMMSALFTFLPSARAQVDVAVNEDVAVNAEIAPAVKTFKQDPEDFIFSWLAGVDQDKYKESWYAVSPDYKAKTTSKQWEEQLSATRKPLGRLRSRVPTEKKSFTTLLGGPKGEYYAIIFKTAFDKKDCVETVILIKSRSGLWQIVSYEIK